jgi:hypothetical protein
MSMSALPLIYRQEIDAVGNNPHDFISLFISKYHELISADPSGQIQYEFNTEQNILLAFHTLDEQASSGGFIQLIENGYGAYIFDSPLSDHLRSWGAVQMASIIDQARVIYLQKKEILEREKTLEEFAKLYLEHREFETIEEHFNTVIDAERAIIKFYIESNISLFAKIAD